VKTHLLTQMVRSQREHSCLYRQTEENGVVLKCAAGCLIGDDEYTADMDDNEHGTGWYDLVDLKLVPDHSTSKLISDLQRMHDTCVPEQWEEKLRNCAIENNLIW
jgi:hypothetical protein